MSTHWTGRTADDGQNRRSARPWPLVRLRWAVAGCIVGIVGSSWAHLGPRLSKQSDALTERAQKPDGAIDGAVRQISEGLEDATSNIRGRYNSALSVANNNALVTEVIARLSQDKSLDSRQIDVFVEKTGTVVLKGQVPDTASRDLAIDLTRDIRGVVNVEDHLAIPPKGRMIAAASDEDPTTATKPRRTR
jgi:hypothetical protein